MATVRFAPILRQYTGNAKQVTAQGNTLAELLSNLYERYPDLREQLQPESEQELSRFVNVYVNDEDVRHKQKLETPIGESDVVIFLPAMAGGR